jgi:hypothetical protein
VTASVTDGFGGSAGALNGRTTDTGGLTWAADSGLRLDGSGHLVNNGAQYTAVGRVTPVGSAGEDLDVALFGLTIDTGYAAGLQLADDGSGNLYQVNLNEFDLTVVLYRLGVLLLTAPVSSVTGVDLSARLRLRGSEAVITVAVDGVDRLIYTDTSPLTGRGCSCFLQQLGTNKAGAFAATATTPATSVGYSDAFNRANGAPGAPWVQGGNGTATIEIVSNALANVGPYGGSSSGQQPTVKQDVGVGDLDLQAKVAALPNADDMGLVFRAGPAYGPSWYAGPSVGGTLLMYSPLVGSPSSGGTIAAGGILRVTVIDDIVTMFADGVYIDHRVEASGRNEIWAGVTFEFNDSAGRFDDFVAWVIPRRVVGWSVGRIAW